MSASELREPPVAFDAVVSKVATLADGGIRVTLDLLETATGPARWLMDRKREGVALRVAVAVAVDDQEDEGGKAESSN